MNIQIKSRFTAAVLFEHDTENNSIRMTLELAIKSGANLSSAYLNRAARRERTRQGISRRTGTD